MAEIILLAASITPGQGLDVAQRLPSKNVLFSVSSAWNVIRPLYPKVDWASLVRFVGAIPKHSFIHWLAQLDRLPTKQRVSQYILALIP